MSGPLTRFGLAAETAEQRKEKILAGVMAAVYRQVPQSVLVSVVGAFALVMVLWYSMSRHALMALVHADPGGVARARPPGVQVPSRGRGRRRGPALGQALGRAGGARRPAVGRRRVHLLLQRPAAAPGGAGGRGAVGRVRFADALRQPSARLLLVHAAHRHAADRAHGVGTGPDLLHGRGGDGGGLLLHRVLRPQLRRRGVRVGEEQLRERGPRRPVDGREAPRRGRAARGRERDAVEDPVLRGRQPRPAPAAAGHRHLRVAAEEARDRPARAAGEQHVDGRRVAVEAGRGTAGDLAARLRVHPAEGRPGRRSTKCSRCSSRSSRRSPRRRACRCGCGVPGTRPTAIRCCCSG